MCLEVLEKYSKEETRFEHACCIYATAPLIKTGKLIEGFRMLQSGAFDVVFPVGVFSSPIWRSFKRSEDGTISMNFPEHEKKRSQDLPAAYYDAGQFYWFALNSFFNLPNKNIFGQRKGAVILGENEVQDIDNPDDWSMAELKFTKQSLK